MLSPTAPAQRREARVARASITSPQLSTALSLRLADATAEPSTAVPLCDVSLVKRVEGANVDWSDNVFEVQSAAET